tara:strand:+ start:971 stop:1108 length:138 start_codon:yes stop_codon:yes gene_type:complete
MNKGIKKMVVRFDDIKVVIKELLFFFDLKINPKFPNQIPSLYLKK